MHIFVEPVTYFNNIFANFKAAYDHFNSSKRGSSHQSTETIIILPENTAILLLLILKEYSDYLFETKRIFEY